MKKSRTGGASGMPSPLLKFLLLMKLSFAILLITCLQVAAEGYSQGEFSLHYKKMEVSKILTAMQKQGPYRFFYNNGYLNQLGKVDIEVSKASLPDVLGALLGTKFNYTITNENLVIISPVGEDNVAGVAVVDNEVKGKITDEAGKPLSGVTVKVQGTDKAVTTNDKGEFTVTVPEGAVLEVSYVGYKTQTLAAKGQKFLSINLQPNATGLNEVVVVGYGTQRKRDVTGTISTVKGDDVKNIPVANPATALQGRASGVDIVRDDGAPGAVPSIRIRGTGTLNNSDPLVVIDGVPAGTLNDVNPNDVASIEILKDASSSAIYGTRAANGVVLITTKHGSYGDKVNISLNGYTGSSHATKYLDLMKAPELYTLKRETFTNDGALIPTVWTDSATYGVQRTDWQRALLGKGNVNNGDLAIRGGNAISNYSISGNFYDEKGMIVNSYFKRYSTRINSEHKLGTRIKVGENFLFSRRSGSAPDTKSTQTGLVWSALRFNPAIPVMNADGSWGSSKAYNELGDINNPVFTASTNDLHNTNNNLLTNGYIEIELLKGLKLRGNLGYDQEVQEAYTYYPATPDQTRVNSLAQLIQSHYEYSSLLNEVYLTYNGQFGDHSLNFTGGYSGQTSKGYGYSAERDGFTDTDPNQLVLNNGNASNQKTTGYVSNPTVLLSYFVRGNYSYKGKYLLTATMRADGSGRFAPGHQWGYFPAFSLGWRISDEGWFKNMAPAVSSLKLTGGWGQLGNQNVADFQYLGILSASNQYNLGNPTTIVNASYLTSLSNPNITWERAEMTNISLEFGLLKNHLTGSLTYFNKDTKDMLIPASVVETYGAAPSIYGNITVPDQNQGILNNHGLEIELNYSNTAGKLSYSFGVNGAIMRNKVTHLYGDSKTYIPTTSFYGRESLETSRTYEGQPIASFYGWKTNGLYQNQADIDKDAGIANDSRKANIKPGDVRFVDVNKDGIIDDNDRVRLGDPNPRFTFGFHGNLAYKGFDLSFNFAGQTGVKLYNADRMAGLDATQVFNFYAEQINRWHGEGTSNSIPRLTRVNSNLNYRSSDLWIQSGNYLSLKSLTLGYSIKPKGEFWGLQLPESRIYVSSYNLFMITGYKGYTPEIGYSNGNRQRGVDVAQYPSARNFTVGASFNF